MKGRSKFSNDLKVARIFFKMKLVHIFLATCPHRISRLSLTMPIHLNDHLKFLQSSITVVMSKIANISSNGNMIIPTLGSITLNSMILTLSANIGPADVFRRVMLQNSKFYVTSSLKFSLQILIATQI